jgi:ferrous iron transport protein B
MNVHFALAGNPNSGKTTLFNLLTGTRQTTGNWPGVTVEKKVGVIRHGPDLYTVVDLPGIYSLSPFSVEEIVTRNYILYDNPDVIVNIVDATNLERNLYLTMQLKRLGRPMIVALNMMDEVAASGDKLDPVRLEELLGIKVVPISAKQGQGIAQLMQAVQDLAMSHNHFEGDHHHVLTERPFGALMPDGTPLKPERARRLDCQGDCDSAAFFKGRRRFRGECRNCPQKTRGISGALMRDYLHEHDHSKDIPENLAELPDDFMPETDDETHEIYKQVTQICSASMVRCRAPEDQTRSERIDRVLTHKFFALPIFALVMFLIFQVTFHEQLGGRLTELLDGFFGETLSEVFRSGLVGIGAPMWLQSLLVDGVIAGVGGVLTFLPQISILFFFLSILEDTGYMSRAAFMVDRIFREFGLSGRSFIPMVMGFGCTVPAIMATRTLENERDRRLTIMITPFMSCGARMPIYAFFSSIFFATNKGLVTFSMYILGIAVAALSAVLLSKTVLKGEDSSFLIELPPYRMPDARSLGLRVWDKVGDFIIRAGTLIFAMSIVIWFMQSFTLSLSPTPDSAHSILGIFGGLLAPLFAPLGFGNWQSSVTLLTGLIAKEAVVATLGILFAPHEIPLYFSPLTAYAFMTFTLLYTPCIAALGAIAREMNSWRWTLLTVAYQIGVAYLFALLVFQGGRLLGLGA